MVSIVELPERGEDGDPHLMNQSAAAWRLELYGAQYFGAAQRGFVATRKCGEEERGGGGCGSV